MRIAALCLLALALCAGSALLCGCTSQAQNSPATEATGESAEAAGEDAEAVESAEAAVNFDRSLGAYSPKKKEYNFYFNYKIVHPWWDAVALGMEDAATQYRQRGIIINYEYRAPKAVSASSQIASMQAAAEQDYDVIGVDVADVEAVTPAINELIESGQKVMTFSSSDATKGDGCKRLAYVGNTHNYKDGADLTEALCKKLGYEGTVAILVGSKGAPCHEDRAKGARAVVAKYPKVSIVQIAYDEDSVENAYNLTKQFLHNHPDLDGIICCNMSNPVGAARAVVEAGMDDKVTIVGMDHDQEALEYLRDGVIYALGVQD